MPSISSIEILFQLDSFHMNLDKEVLPRDRHSVGIRLMYHPTYAQHKASEVGGFLEIEHMFSICGVDGGQLVPVSLAKSALNLARDLRSFRLPTYARQIIGRVS